MARNFGRRLIHQIYAELFESGTSGNLGSNTGLAGSSQIVPSQRISKEISKEMDWFLAVAFLNVSAFGVSWFCYKTAGDMVMDEIKERDEALRKMMEKNGVNREFCEAKIADIKRKMGPASTSETERTILQVYERWMQVVTRGQGQTYTYSSGPHLGKKNDT